MKTSSDRGRVERVWGDSSCTTILAVVGTRPEVIKMAPVLRALEIHNPPFRVQLCVVHQQTDLVDQAVAEWELTPDFRIDLSGADHRLTSTLAEMLPALERVYQACRPNLILVHGDTTTTLGASLAAFYAHCPIAHVEAGLRSGLTTSPFPEEMDRLLVDRLATIHYVPTEAARAHLRSEGYAEDSIVLVGNTVVDALRLTLAQPKRMLPVIPPGSRLLLATGHRRENFGRPQENVCRALKSIAETREDVSIIYVLHSNPAAADGVREMLANVPRVTLLPPIGHRDFLSLLVSAHLVLTDSGGVQEEAACLGRPVLLTRDVTERMEVVRDGVGMIVGTHAENIAAVLARLLDDAAAYSAMAHPVDAFGDGYAAGRLCQDLLRRHQAGTLLPPIAVVKNTVSSGSGSSPFYEGGRLCAQ